MELAGERVPRLGQDRDQVVAGELVDRGDDRQAADELGDQPVLHQVLGQHLLEALAGVLVGVGGDLGAEADAVVADPPLDHLVELGEGAAADEEDVGVSIVRNSWCGCLRPPWGGTEAVVPSRIFRSACCTPSPETSRVIDGLSALRAILSISSM